MTSHPIDDPTDNRALMLAMFNAIQVLMAANLNPQRLQTYLRQANEQQAAAFECNGADQGLIDAYEFHSSAILQAIPAVPIPVDFDFTLKLKL